MNNTCVIIIPARLESSRLKRKLLLDKTGKPLIQHTYENAKRASIPDDVIIAADSPEIIDAVRPFGAKAVLTSPSHQSGTDRIAEVSRNLEAGIIINVQGDEPGIDPGTIDGIAQKLLEDPSCLMTTAACPLEPNRINDPSCVKVVVDKNGNALYFSRAPIPFKRDPDTEYETGPFLHIGVYGYRNSFLQEITAMGKSSLEKVEKLEQLRVLENGHAIHVINVTHASPGIDTQDDYETFFLRFKENVHER